MTIEDKDHYAYWGAVQLALWMQDFLTNAKSNDDYRVMCKPETLSGILHFLCQNKSDMLNLLLNKEGLALRMAPVKDKKGKLKTYKPISLVWNGYSRKQIEECELISPQEYKYRDSAKILCDALKRATDMIAVLTGNGRDSIFNNLIAGDPPDMPETFGEVPTVTVRDRAVFFIITEKDYAEMVKEKKAAEAKRAAAFKEMPVEERLKNLDVGFRVFKVEDVDSGGDNDVGQNAINSQMPAR